MSYPTITVSALNAHIKDRLEEDPALKSVLVQGEISNLSLHRGTGHYYFTLKDDKSALRAVMFRMNALRLRFQPENGMLALAAGRVGVYERDGTYQLYVNELIPDGVGALQLAFAQLKERLEKEGLFDPAHKKALPAFPKRIGVITSLEGAVRRDIENVVRRRWPHVELVLYGVTVQGASAAGEIAEAVRWFDKKQDVDLLIVARGGGSMEDLWCFNDETLARVIYDCTLPVISAVGHETDFTICDFVADRRAPTPSAAAELAVPDADTLRRELWAQSNALLNAYKRLVSVSRHRLDLVNARRDFSDLSVFFDGERERVSRLADRMASLTEKRLAAERLRSVAAGAALLAAAGKDLPERRGALERVQARLSPAAFSLVQRENLRLTRDVTALKKLNPLDVLLRGFAVVETDAGAVSSVKGLSPGDRVRTVLSDGSLNCLVEDVKEGIPYGKHDL